MTINEMSIGQQASWTKTVTETDVYMFAGITGDLNPAHVNQVASEKNIAKIETVCTNQDGKVVIKGMATVMPPKA